MKQLFKVEDGIKVPDGTMVHPIIGPRQMFEARIGMFEHMSLVMGDLPPKTESGIHIHPICEHLTWVISGCLTVRMKDPSVEQPYTLEVSENQLVLTRAGTFFQLINHSDKPVKTLYGCAPAYVFELDADGNIVYNDQIVPNKSWEELAKMNWQLPEMTDLALIRKNRAAALKRMTDDQKQ
jgi:mannose-6-phosphate isomerase-like protein (cupin superfamily)